MIKINGTTITMTRGDTLRLVLTLKDEDGNTYTPLPGDQIRFAMKHVYDDANPLILKDIPNDSLELVINPEDTKNLECGPVRGKYKYDIELVREQGTWVDTFIPRADFLVLEEVL